MDEFYKSILNPVNPETELLLIGIVGYHGIGGLKRRSSEGIAHYTAFIYRRGNTGWMEVDDLQKKSIYRPLSYKIVPRLLIYVKNKKSI